MLPDAHSAVPDAREAVRLALEDGTPELVGQAYSNLVDCLQCDGEEIAGVAAAKEGVDAVTQRGLGIRYGSWLRTQAAELCLAYGAWDQAEDLLQAALRDTRHVVGTNRDYALVNHARLRGLRGDVEGSPPTSATPDGCPPWSSSSGARPRSRRCSGRDRPRRPSPLSATTSGRRRPGC